MEPLIYSMVEENILKEMLKTFYGCINLPIQIIDEHGNILVSCGEMSSFCTCLRPFIPESDNCNKLHAKASKRAISYGDSYVFSCHADLDHIVYPLIHKNIFMGSVLVGPFVMDDPDSLLISNVVHKYQIPIDDALELSDKARELPFISPSLVTQISRLLYFLFSSLITDGREDLKKNNEQFLQQSRINESIQRYKVQSSDYPTYPYEEEKKLIMAIKTKNIAEGKKIINELLGYVFFAEGNNLDILKSRAIEICSVLSRIAIEAGGQSEIILKLNNKFLQDVRDINSFETLCFKLQEVVEQFFDSTFDNQPTINQPVIKKAMAYISKNFNRSLTLEEVSEYVHLNPSYFSKLFKKLTRTSFKEYLNFIRVEESKLLLTNSDFSILDIAIAVGFEDQSYFTKVFKKYTNLTPKQFREI